METKELVDWLRGFGTAQRDIGNDDVADMIMLAAGYMDRLYKRTRIAEAQRNQAWDELARIKGEFEYERISQD